MKRLSNSLRWRDPEETWGALVKQAPKFGVTRVTDTTRLDVVGVPVAAAIRPFACDGSLCVSAGKSTTVLEAKLGALCEAFELACAEPDLERHDVVTRDVAYFEHQSDLRLCDLGVNIALIRGGLSRKNVDISPLEEIDLVECKDWASGQGCLLPASLVFFPYRNRPGSNIFTTTSNGLAGGNTEAEAHLHALLELLERDSLTLSESVWPERARRVEGIEDRRWNTIAQKLHSLGLDIQVTACLNEFYLPMFDCRIFDFSNDSPVVSARGQGLHLDRSIALFRATTEALQSRLTNIHGGRDDIVNSYMELDRIGRVREVSAARAAKRAVDNLRPIQFEELPSLELGRTIEDNLSLVVTILHSLGFSRIFSRTISIGMEDYVVVRVIVPGLEYRLPKVPRAGVRLWDIEEKKRSGR